MTLKQFKEKIKSLEDFGIIDDNTHVCGFDADLKELYMLGVDHGILLDINKIVEGLENDVRFYELGMPEKAEMKRKQINKLQQFGNKVICLMMNS